jgi:hypothetical protein
LGIAACAALLAGAMTHVQQVTRAQDLPAPGDIVAPVAYAAMNPAARGQTVRMAVVLKVREGFHINARPASFDYLIPTGLQTEFPAGFTAGSVAYPAGTLRTFEFTKTPLSVYEGTVILRLPVKISGAAPLGEQKLAFQLRYQACNDHACLPPVTIPVGATVNVVASARQAKPAHGELFRKR